MTIIELYAVYTKSRDTLHSILTDDTEPYPGVVVLDVAAGIYDALQEPTTGDKFAVKALREAMAEALEYLVVGILHGGADNRVVWQRALDMLIFTNLITYNPLPEQQTRFIPVPMEAPYLVRS